MKFEEYYDEMSSIDIEKLNKIWSITGSDCDVSAKKYLKDPVMRFFFRNEYFKKAFTGEIQDIFIGKKPQEYLKYKVLGFELPHDKEKRYLRENYILFGDTIPDDFEEVILKYVQSKAMLDTNSEPINVEASSFLKLILMINYVHKNKLDVSKMFKAVDIEKGIISRAHFINYLKTRHLLTDDGNYINSSNLSKWINNKDKSMVDFYRFMTVQVNSKDLLDFFKIIIKAFGNSDQWIKVQEFRKIFDAFAQEVETGIKLGLIVIKKYDEEFHMKLSSEVWYMVTGVRPNKWNRKDVLVTPLKEVFVPYYFDPFVIQIIDFFGDVKTDKKGNPIKYCDDYFIISDVAKERKVENSVFDFTEMVKCIEKYCDNMPNIVRDEMINSMDKKI